jgi:uncharacterized membrane protein YcaP (DUF421 family)
MDAVLRAVVVYLFLLIVIRIAGKRSVSQLTTFDLVVILILSEATQQALLGDDFSVLNAFLVIMTLVGLQILFDSVGQRWKRFGRVIDGSPVVVLEDGRPLSDRLKRARVDEADILEQARRSQGIESLDQIKYAVLERGGGISVIPKSSG